MKKMLAEINMLFAIAVPTNETFRPMNARLIIGEKRSTILLEAQIVEKFAEKDDFPNQ
jgi:hypothetical protein